MPFIVINTGSLSDNKRPRKETRVRKIIVRRSKTWHRTKTHRRRLRRAFLKWLDLNLSNFAIEIKLGRRTAEALEFSFVGINDVVTGSLGREINVDVTYKGCCWDLVLSTDEPDPVRVPGGYACTLCLPEFKKVSPDLFALYSSHLFEPFLEFVNEKLAKANWLALQGSREEGFTWAELKEACRKRTKA